MTIRQPNKDDKRGILDLIKEFHNESLTSMGLNYCETVCDQLVDKFSECSLVAEHEGKIVGCIGGMIVTPLSGIEKCYQEMIWFTSRDHVLSGVKLLKELERKCVEWGVKKIVMCHMADNYSDKVSRFYGLNGYKLFELHYVKTIT